MRFVIAPDSYKGSLSASEVATTMRDAIFSVHPGALCDVIPMADGGEGTLDAIVRARGGHTATYRVSGPDLVDVDACLGVIDHGETIVVELAQAAGLTRLPVTARNPLYTSTYGVGQLMAHALDLQPKRMVIGLGGSATNDGGMGLLAALGVEFRDVAGDVVPPTGAGMMRVEHVDASGLDPRLRNVELVVACDVTAPLVGPTGASYVFGPQKGADAAMVTELDGALAAFSQRVQEALRISADTFLKRGAGAAGGSGFALLGIGGRMESGAQLVADIVELDAAMKQADVVLTGEGRSDGQTLTGKVPAYVASVARKYELPVHLLSGSFDRTCKGLFEAFDSVHAALCEPVQLEDAMRQAQDNLFIVTQNVIRLFR